MNRAFSAGWMVATALFLAAACSTTGGSLSSSAERLERSSYALERNAYGDRDSGFRRDAVALAEEARDFRRTLADSRADNEDIRDAFSDVSRTYHELRDEVERSRSTEAERDFRPVTDAYLDVEREMGRNGERRDRYARD
jgi:hypothetical protein